ncbi:MAG: type II and III secretion system protein family protein [Methylocystis sp.]
MSRPVPLAEGLETRPRPRVMTNAIASLLSLALTLALTLRPILAEPLAANHVSAELGRATRIQMGAGKTVLVDLPRDAAEIVVGNPAVVNAVVRTPRKIYLMGAGLGQTTVFALDSQGQRFADFEISVGRDVGELTPLLRATIPNSKITVRTVSDTIILTGSVASPRDAQRAMDIAKGFAAKKNEDGSGGVIDGMQIRGEDQVMLKVTVAEVSRTVLKQLGVSTGANPDVLGNWGVLTNGNPFAVNGALNGPSALTLKNLTGGGTSLTVQAFERYSVARVLAEPTVTAVSGESAKVVVGGEIAVPGPGGCAVGAGGVYSCAPAVAFKPYGVTLGFTPVVQAEGRIQLHLITEVTEIDLTTQVTISGASVPGFKTRKNETTIELPSGGAMATAGLLTQMSGHAINGLPGLLDMPVLGALFRSSDYQRQETELLVIVCPYIVKPISQQQVVRPDDNFQDASDPQAWLLGRVNRIYATRNDPELTRNYKGRIGFIHD